MEYKIDVLNKFAAFQMEEDVDEDPYETLLKLKEQIVAKKIESSKTTTNKKVSSTTLKNEKNAKLSTVQPPHSKTNTIKTQNQPQSNTVTKPLPNRPPRMGGISYAEKENKERVEQKEGFSEGFRERNTRGEMGVGRGGMRRGRGGRVAEATERTGKREFERHSGSDKSGFKPTEKKEGGGSHNWGSIKDDINDQDQENEADQVAKETMVDNLDGHKTDGEEGKTEDEAAVEEKQLTLDEWKQMEEQKRVRNNFKIRKPGEGCSGDPKWNKMFVLKKKADEEDEEEMEDMDEDEEGVRKKNLVPIAITFNDQQKRGGRGGGRGRGGNRGRGGENGPSRSSAVSAPVPNVDDVNDFPSLA